MKTITVVVALLVALVCHTSLTAVQGKESVAELRRLRALGSGYNSNGHHFGGDNGRDHPAQYQQQQAAAAAAQEEQTEDTSVTTTTSSNAVVETTAAKALAEEEEVQAEEFGVKTSCFSSLSTGATVGILVGASFVILLLLAAFCFKKTQDTLPVPTKDVAVAGDDIEDATTKSDASSTQL